MPLPRSQMLAAALVLMTGACGRSPEPTPEQAQTAGDRAAFRDFNAVEATGPDDVVITIGNGFSVKPRATPRPSAGSTSASRTGG